MVVIWPLAAADDRRHARAHRLAVDQHRAGAALREPAAELRAVQLEVVAQDVEQRGVRLDRRRSSAAPFTRRVNVAMVSSGPRGRGISSVVGRRHHTSETG